MGKTAGQHTVKRYTVYRLGIDETERMSKEEILAYYSDQLQPTTWLHFRGYDIALDTLARHLVRELLEDRAMQDFTDRLEHGNLSDFYRATFEQWLEWKLERDTPVIEVDECWDEGRDEMLRGT